MTVTFGSRAAVRRALGLLPHTACLRLAAPLRQCASEGLPPAEIVELLTAYVFDPRAGAILATTDARARWLDGPLFAWVGPGNAAPLDDRIAALLVGPLLGDGTALAPALVANRFVPRADDVVALAVAALEPPAQAAALEALFADPGPDADVLALSAVQCGRVLAWSPHLLELAVAEAIVDALLAVLDPARPRPLLAAVAEVLGPIAAWPGPFAERVCAAAVAGLDAAEPPRPGSFRAELDAIGKARAVPERVLALPRREVAAACARILGAAAPQPRADFVRHRALVLDRAEAGDLLVAFVDGLVASAHVPAVAELVATLLDGDDAEAETALGLASSIPLDPIAGALVGQLDAASESRRIAAAAAVELLDATPDLDVDHALALRLADPSPEVAAAATRSLLARGRRDLIAKATAREAQPVRRAVLLAGLGELSVPVIGELVSGTLTGLDALDPTQPDDRAGASPIARLLADCLLGSASPEGLGVASDLIGGVPDAVGLLALAGLAGAERDIGVLAPPGARSRLAQVTLPIATSGGDPELGALALYVLARVSAGDETIAELVAEALASSDGYAADCLTALGELRVATAHTAAAVAPLIAASQPIGARVVAAAICGRVLPADHPAWADIRELLELGTIARAAAWSALRDRARRHHGEAT